MVSLRKFTFSNNRRRCALPKTRLQLNLARLLSGDIIVDDLSLTQPKIAIDTSVMPPLKRNRLKVVQWKKSIYRFLYK